MVQYIFTPWRDQQELLTVRRQLYPSYHETLPKPTGDEALRHKQEAVARVSMWMQRGNCPHLVESTALLVAAILSDTLATSERSLAGSASSYAVRAAYSAAFSRFVTGLMDSHQDKARKMSMYAVAKSVGLPATFVELRHQATHEQLPSLTRLRAAAEKALDWIYEYYWRHLDEAGPPSGADGARAEREAATATAATSCHKLLAELFSTDDRATEARIRGELKKRKTSEVYLATCDINQGAKEGRVLRKGVAFLRELLESDPGLVPMDEDQPMPPVERRWERPARDLETYRRMIDEDRRELERVAEQARARALEEEEQEQEQAAGTLEEGPAWSRYDKSSWVPKPIGLV